MKHGKMKKVVKDKLFLGAMLLCLVLLTTVATATIMNRNSNKDGGQYLDLDSSTEEVVDGTKENNELVNNDLTNDTTGGQVANEDPSEDETRDQQVADGEETTQLSSDESPAQQVDGNQVQALNLSFTNESTMQWPIQGNILRDFCMDETIYHATLEQYKVSPEIIIQGEVDAQVVAPVDAQVMAVGANEEIGTYITLNLGNEYRVVLGQLKNVTVEQGQYVTAGTVVGAINTPTKYYSVEGPSLYFQLLNGEVPLDPVDFIQ